MDASFTCWNCGRGFRAGIAERVVCPFCAEPTFLNVAQDQVPPPEEARPRSEPFEPGWTFLGKVRTGPRGYEVVTEIPHAVHPCLFDGLRAGDAGQVVGVPLVYEVIGTQQGALVLQLRSELSNGDEIDPRTVYVDPERIAHRLQRLKPFAPGESPLERLYVEHADQVVPRVEFLAGEKNDPAALWELAHGWRLDAIRPPIDQALRRIGAPRLVRMVMQNTIDWDPDFLDFVDELREADARSRGGGGSTLPHNLSGWDRPWWVDD